MNNKTAATKETTKRAMAKPSQAKLSQTKKIIISIFKKNAKRDSVHEKHHFLKRKYEEAKRQNKNQKPSQAKPSQATGPPRAPPGSLRHYIFMLKRTQTIRQEKKKKIPADPTEPQPNAHRDSISRSVASPSL